MERQTIIYISREFGSGGHDVGKLLSERFGIPMYDRDLLQEIAKEMHLEVSKLKEYDEKPTNYLLSRRVGKYSNSMEDILAEKQFEFIRRKADEGESFVVVGRCAETVLKDKEGLISIFIRGEEEYKVKRLMEFLQCDRETTLDKKAKIDRKRKQFHNRYSDFRWGDLRFYDLTINATHLGVEGTAKLLEDYIRARIEKQQ